MKGYISVREASYKWGVSERRVNQYCTQGRIPGISRFGRSWCIPADAQKPNTRKGIDAGNHRAKAGADQHHDIENADAQIKASVKIGVKELK